MEKLELEARVNKLVRENNIQKKLISDLSLKKNLDINVMDLPAVRDIIDDAHTLAACVVARADNGVLIGLEVYQIAKKYTGGGM